MPRHHFRGAQQMHAASGKSVEFQISSLPEGMRGRAVVSPREQFVEVCRTEYYAIKASVRRYDLATEVMEHVEINWPIADRHGRYAAEVSVRNAATDFRDFVKAHGGFNGIVAAMSRGEIDTAARTL